MDEKKQIDPEGAFLSEAIQVIKAINARTAVLIAEYEHIRKAMGQTDEAKST